MTKKQDPDSVDHFCDVPSVALCGVDLAGPDGNFLRFHKHTTNCFADITCDGCRRAVYEQELKPGGFPPSAGWKGFIP